MLGSGWDWIGELQTGKEKSMFDSLVVADSIEVSEKLIKSLGLNEDGSDQVFRSFYRAYEKAKVSSNPAYEFIDQFLIQKLFVDKNFSSCIKTYNVKNRCIEDHPCSPKNALLPEHFLGFQVDSSLVCIDLTGPGIETDTTNLPVIFYGILHLLIHVENPDEKKKAITDFLESMKVYCLENAVPFYLKWNGLGVEDLVELIAKRFSILSFLKLKSELVLNKNSCEKTSIELKSNFISRWNYISELDQSICDNLESLKEACRVNENRVQTVNLACNSIAEKQPLNGPSLVFVLDKIQCMIHYLIKKSFEDSEFKPLDHDIRYFEFLVNLKNNLSSSKEILPLHLLEIEASENKLLTALQCFDFPLYIVKTLQKKRFNLSFIKRMCKDHSSKIESLWKQNPGHIKEETYRFILEPQVALFSRISPIFLYTYYLHRSEKFARSIQSNATKVKDIAKSKLEKYKNSELGQYAYYGISPTDFTNYISAPKLRSEQWRNCYCDLASSFLPLLQMKEVLWGIENALIGRIVNFSDQTKLALSLQIENLFIAYCRHAEVSRNDADDALNYFFSQELPRNCVQLFVPENGGGDPLRSSFTEIIQKIAETTKPAYEKADSLLSAFVSQVPKVIDWKIQHSADWMNAKIENEKTPMLVLVLSENQVEGISIFPGFFEFSAEFSLMNYLSDSKQVAKSLLKEICSDRINVKDGLIHLRYDQFVNFYWHLKEQGCSSGHENKIKFLLIAQKNLSPKVTTHRGLRRNVPRLEEAKAARQVISSDQSMQVVWSTKSLLSLNSISRQTGLFAHLQDGIVVLDNLKRKKDRREFFEASENFVSSLSHYLYRKKDQDLDSVSSFYKKTLKPYQKDSVKQLLKLKQMGIHGGFLNFDTSLGKTATLVEFSMQLLSRQPKPVIFTGTKSALTQSEDSFRKYIGELILDELEDLVLHFEEICRSKTKKNYEELECIYAILSMFPLSLEKRRKKILTEEKSSEKRLSRTSWIVELREKALKIRQNYIDQVENRYGLDLTQNGDGQNLIKKNFDLLKDGFCSFDLFEKIVYVDSWDQDHVKTKIHGGGIFLVSLKALENTEMVQQLSPQAVLVYESQYIDNLEKVNFGDVAKILEALPEKPFTVFASGDLLSQDLVTLLSFLTPSQANFEENSSIMPVTRLCNQFAKDFRTLAEKFRSISESSQVNENPTLLQEVYPQLRRLFYQMEAFKRTLHKVTINCQKKDPIIKAQWENRIPNIIRHSHQLALTPLQNQQLGFLSIKARELGFKTSLYNNEVCKILFSPDNQENKSMEDILSWSLKESPMLTYFLTATQFENESKEGVVIFVHDAKIGKIIQLALSKKFRVPIEFLNAEQSTSEKQAIAKRFSTKLDGNPRVLIMDTSEKSSGIHFKDVGKHAYFCYTSVYPELITEVENLIVRADSTKDVVNIHSFHLDSSYDRFIKWKAQRRLSSDQYLFSGMNSDLSNAYLLFGDIFNLICYELPNEKYTDVFALKMHALKKIMLQFAQQDKNFLEGLRDSYSLEKAMIGNNQDQNVSEIFPNKIYYEKEKEKEKEVEVNHVWPITNIMHRDDVFAPLDPDDLCAPHQKGKEKTGAIKRKRIMKEPNRGDSGEKEKIGDESRSQKRGRVNSEQSISTPKPQTAKASIRQTPVNQDGVFFMDY